MNRVFSMAQRYLVGKAMTAAAILAVTGAGTSAFAALPIISTPTSALAANYSITSDGHVHFFYGSSSGWSQLDITAASNSVGAAPTTALTEVYNASKNSFEVLYVGSDGQIYGIYSIGTTWLYESPTALAGAPAATNSAALTSVDLSGNGTDRVYYVGPAGHIEELAAGGSTGWGVTDVTATIASGSPAVAGTALTSLVYATTDTPRIYFFDANWHLQELNFGEGWHEADVTAQSGGPAAVSGSSLTSLIYRTDPSDADEAPRV